MADSNSSYATFEEWWDADPCDPDHEPLSTDDTTSHRQAWDAGVASVRAWSHEMMMVVRRANEQLNEKQAEIERLRSVIEKTAG